MALLERTIERPSILDRPSEQLALGASAAVALRERPTAMPLSERLRRERAAQAATVAAPASANEHLATRRSGGATLDDMLVGAWEGLSASRSVACPVCRGAMRPRRDAQGGSCGDCGAQVR